MDAPENAPKPAYAIDGRQWIAHTDDVRVQILTLGPGQEVPWHSHTTVTDTFTCLDGPMVVQTMKNRKGHALEAGETFAIAPQTPHRVAGKGDGPCRFLIVQGVGTYDFVPFEPPA